MSAGSEASDKTSIILSGWHGHDNAGDDATLIQFVAELTRGRDDRNVTVLSELPERVIDAFGVDSTFHYETVGLHGLTHLLKGRWTKHLALLRGSKLFALGGGSLLRDNTTWHNLFRVVDEIFWARLFGVPVALYAIGVGPFRSWLGKLVIREAAKCCALITVREERSKGLLVGLGIAPERVHVVADPAFLLQARAMEGERAKEEAELLELASKPKTVGLFPSLGFIEDGTDLSQVPRLAAGLDALHEEHGLHFVSLPMRVLPDSGEIDDVYVAGLIRDKMRHPDALTIHPRMLRADELKWLTSRFLFNLTIRLHGMIFSLSEKTPVVAIHYEPKVFNVLTSFGLERLSVDMGEGMEERIANVTRDVLTNRDTLVQHIEERLDENERSARRTFELMEEVLASAK